MCLCSGFNSRETARLFFVITTLFICLLWRTKKKEMGKNKQSWIFKSFCDATATYKRVVFEYCFHRMSRKPGMAIRDPESVGFS